MAAKNEKTMAAFFSLSNIPEQYSKRITFNIEGWIFFSLSNIPEQFSTRRHSLVSRYLLISLL
jgi:hypothetical protein